MADEPIPDGAIDTHSDEMTPGRAAFEIWYANMAHVSPADVSADAWRGLGDHQAVWDAVAEAAITAYEDPENLGPIARDMEPEELERFKQKLTGVLNKPGIIIASPE